MHRKTTAIALSVMLAAILLFISSGFVYADPVQEKKEELERIKNEVQRIDSQLETVTEQYNLTNLRADQARARIAAKESQLASLNAELEQRRNILGDRLREIYKSGNTDILEVITECKTVDDLYTNLDRAQRIGGGDVNIIASVLSSQEEVEAAKAGIESEKAELDAALAELGAQKDKIESDLQRRQSVMSGVETEVNTLIAQEAANQTVTNPRTNPVTYPRTPPPPPPPYASAVVQVAYAQLGKPYQYAGSGPNVFDCSGLVMYCYAQVGVSLPHSSYMQARCGTPVSYAELQQGDLVFFHGYGHVGMYIGNGQYIHAPQTGDVVRIADLGVRRDFCGAVRINY